MSSFLEAMSSLFSFLFTQLSNFASFFITNTLGQVILGCVLFSMIVYLIMLVVSHIRG